jgi:hypothetical protein
MGARLGLPLRKFAILADFIANLLAPANVFAPHEDTPTNAS